MSLKWYVVHAQSGCENKVLLSLKDRMKQQGMESEFGEILLPSESVTESVNGHQRTANKKFYPGYIFVQMNLTEKTYHLVKNTPKVTGFLGGRTPTPVAEKEISQVQSQMVEGVQKPRARVSFEEGDQIRVIDGAFANFSGIVDEVKADKQKLKVRVSIFGRAASVELEYSQVEKMAS